MVTVCFFFFNDTATTEIYTLSLHDALPIWGRGRRWRARPRPRRRRDLSKAPLPPRHSWKGPDLPTARRLAARLWTGGSEEHTSELPSRQYIVCRLLLEKKNKSYSYIFVNNT